MMTSACDINASTYSVSSIYPLSATSAYTHGHRSFAHQCRQASGAQHGSGTEPSTHA